MLDSPCSFNTGHHRHEDVRKHDIGLEFGGHIHHLFAVGRFADNADILRCFQQASYSEPYNFVVIRYQYPYLRHNHRLLY